MKRTLTVVAMAVVVGLASSAARADFDAEMTAAAAKVREIMPGAEALLADGHVNEARAVILAVFPEKTRSPAETLTLGNVLFTQDPEVSYELHKKAATDLPNEPDAQLEWALEQHRAGDYASA